MTFGIESSNIVGYTAKEAAKGKFIMLGAQFDKIDGTKQIADLIDGLTGVPYDEENAFMKTAPQIQIPEGAGYTIRYYLSDGWYLAGMIGEEEDWRQKAGWCDEFGLICDDEYTPGECVWLKSISDSANVVIAGAVPDEDEISIVCPAGFAMRANAFPIEITLNGTQMKETDIIGVPYDEENSFMKTAPQIQIPEGAGYTIRYYLTDGWYLAGMVGEEEDWQQKAGWCDEFGLIAEDVIPVAQGFWTKGVGGEYTATFRK